MGKLIELPRREQPPDGLNAEQRAAVLHRGGPLLVVAGAGTGKTRVIIERIRHLLESDPEMPAESILGLTFTDKAASEMKARVRRATGERGEGAWVGTYHAFCQSVLLAPYPDLRVLDEWDHWIVLRRNMAKLGLVHFRRLAEPGKFLSDFVQFFSRCQDELVTPDDYQKYGAELRTRFEREKDSLEPEDREEVLAEVQRQEEVAKVFRISDALLRERRLFTWGALLERAVAELRSNPELRSFLRAKYRHIVVDEFQDTNIAQIELLAELAADGRDIVAVGDDDQAIYRFRGASFGSFQLFAEKFLKRPFTPGQPDPAVVKLVRNYRSTQRILRVSGQTIQMNSDRVFRDKRLVTENPEGDKPQIVTFGSAEEEAHWVTEEIARRHAAGSAWNEFAVLFRAHAHRDLLVASLLRAEIPLVIKNLTILANPLVRDVIAYLRTIAFPWDDVACARVLAAPAWGLTPADLVRLAERTSRSRGRSLWNVLEDPQADLDFGGRGSRLPDLVLWMTGLRKKAKALPVTDLLDGLIGDMLEGLDRVQLPTAADRRALDRFRQFVTEWEDKKSETKRLREFIQYLEYFREAGGQICLEEEDTSDAVQLMTVHAGKGLEFDHVFVIRLVRGGFPVYKRTPVLEFPEALMKEALPDGDFHVQEERRLFYVALTRARKRLTVTTIEGKGSRRTVPSPFLEDILMEPMIQLRDVQQITPKVELPLAEPAQRVAQRRLFEEADHVARAYSRIAAWAASYHPPVFEPLQLSASAIDTYRTCPQKFLLRQMWRIRGGPAAALTFGSVMHLTIRQFVQGLKKNGRMPFSDVAGIFEREWTAAGFEDAYQEGEYKRDGLEQLEAFHRTYTAEPADVLRQECEFELPLAQNVVITGRMDQINRAGPQEVEIVDYKTGRPREEKDAKKSLQLSIYALAARQVLELDPVRLTFYNLTTNQPVSVAHSDKQLERALGEVQQAAADIRAGVFPAQPGYHCRYCDYEPICPAHEPLVTIRNS